MEEGLKAFQKLADFDKLILLAPDFVINDCPTIVKKSESIPKETGISIETIWLSNKVDEAIAKLRPDMQAIYITPVSHIPRADFKRLITAVNKLKIPTFSHMGETDVEDGVLATIHKRSDLLRLARRVALNIQRILMGENAASLPVDFKSETQLTINMKTAAQIGVYPTWDVMTEAELLNEEEAIAGEKLTLMDTVNPGH